MFGNSDFGEGSQDGGRFEPSSSFFRGEPVSRQREQVQEGSRLVSEADSGEQDILAVGQSRRRLDGVKFQPKSTFFLQLEQTGPRGVSIGCTSPGRGLVSLGESILLPTLSPNRGCVEESGGAESEEDDLGGTMVDIQELSSVAAGI